MPGDSVGTFRVMVTGQPAALVDGSEPIDFSLRDTATGEVTVYHSVFMGPVGGGSLIDDATRNVRRPGRANLWPYFPWFIAGAMGVVIAVNSYMAYSALSTFPGNAGSDGFDLSTTTTPCSIA